MGGGWCVFSSLFNLRCLAFSKLLPGERPCASALPSSRLRVSSALCSGLGIGGRTCVPVFISFFEATPPHLCVLVFPRLCVLDSGSVDALRRLERPCVSVFYEATPPWTLERSECRTPTLFTSSFFHAPSAYLHLPPASAYLASRVSCIRRVQPAVFLPVRQNIRPHTNRDEREHTHPRLVPPSFPRVFREICFSRVFVF